MTFLRSFRELRDWAGLDAAAHKFAEAVEIDPAYQAARFYLGVSQEMIGRHAEAAKEFEALRVQIETPDVDLLYNLGLAYFHQYTPAAYRLALTILDEVLHISRPNESPAERERMVTMNLLTRSLVAQVHSHWSIKADGVTEAENEEHFQKARDTASSALDEFKKRRDEIDPDYRNDIGWALHNAVGHAYLYAGRRENRLEHLGQAKESFRKALEFDGDNYRVLSNLGSAYLFTAKHLLQRSPDDPERTSSLELTAAARYFEKVLSLKPDYDFAYVRLAQIALAEKRFDQAEQYVALARAHPSEMTVDYLDELNVEISRARSHADATD